jgi:hypothetical protein
MKFIRVYSENSFLYECDYLLFNVKQIESFFLESNHNGNDEEKRVVVCCFDKQYKDYRRFYYLGRYIDKAKYSFQTGDEHVKTNCWLDSNFAKELFEELEMMLNKE